MKKLILLFIPVLMLLITCKTAYVPNSINVPLFDDKGQLRLSADSKGNFQFAASPGKRFGIMANAMIRNDGSSSDDIRGKGSFFEAGIGSFSNSSSNMRIESYAGVGFGKTETTQKSNSKSFKANGLRVFFQPSVGYHHKIFELAFTPRLVAGTYSKPTTNYTTQELINDKLSAIDEPTWIFIEPALTARVGYQWLKLQIQVGKSFKLNDKPLAYDNNLSSLGLILDLGRKGYRK